MKRIAWILVFLSFVFLAAGCGGPKEVKTEPETALVPPPPPPPTAPPDPAVGRAYVVLRHFGTLTRKYMSYSEYSRRNQGEGTVASVSPDWFYDTYSLDLNEDGYWAKVKFQTADRAIARDPRIETLLGGAPRHAIDMTVKTPAGRRFILSDSEGDGVLDYAAPAGKQAAGRPAFDADLRDRMQATYTRLLTVIKRYYSRVPAAER